ncbi:hypothetical protein ACFX13_002602 [Malus domestica]
MQGHRSLNLALIPIDHELEQTLRNQQRKHLSQGEVLKTPPISEKESEMAGQDQEIMPVRRPKKDSFDPQDMLMQIDKFYYLMDFIVLDTRHVCYSSTEIPIVLGRPFPATAKANIQCDTGILTLCFGDMKAKFDLYPAHGLESGADHVESIHLAVHVYKND